MATTHLDGYGYGIVVQGSIVSKHCIYLCLSYRVVRVNYSFLQLSDMVVNGHGCEEVNNRYLMNLCDEDWTLALLTSAGSPGRWFAYV